VSAAARVLDRLERPKQVGPGRWIAPCPAHQDRSPSLSIRELDDGRLLLHDFGGCETSAVLASLGLEFSALFPERLPGSGPAGGYAASSSRIPARDLLELVSFESSVVLDVVGQVRNRRAVSEEDWRRLIVAVKRIWRARDQITPAKLGSRA
jgi:hypothetical protein